MRSRRKRPAPLRGRVILAIIAFALVPCAEAAAQQPTLVGTWGTPGPGQGQFSNPEKVAIDSAGNVYVAEPGGPNTRIQKFSADGSYITQWGGFGSAEGQFSSPSGVAVDSSDNVYVADLGNHRVQKFDSNGNFLLMWGWDVGPGPPVGAPEICTSGCGVGSAGNGTGQFFSPRAVTAASGSVYVGEFADHQRVQKFNQNGVYQGLTLGAGTPTTGDGQFAVPIGIALDGGGNIYVAERDNHRVQKFDAAGNFLTKWGTQGTADGQFNGPWDIDIDPSGIVNVADNGNSRVQRFSQQGAFVSKFDRIAPGSTMFRPLTAESNAAGDLYMIDNLPGFSRVLRVRFPAQQLPPPPPPPPLPPRGPLKLADLPDPTQGVTANVEPVGAGPVLVGIPARLASAARVRSSQKGVRFVPLSEARQIPVGSFLDTRKGKVRLQSARDRRGTRQQGDFSSGLFQVLQSRKRSARGLTDLVLKGSSFSRCRARARGKAGAAQSRRIRRLRSSARGRFRTRGRHSAATVRGTVWDTTDRCDGTLTKVVRGRVAVRDFRRKRTILVRAGKSYLARAKR